MSTKHLWKNVPEGVWCWHIHHTQLLELSTEPLKKRAKYILEEKPEDERKLRLQLMRPVLHPEKFPKQLIKASAELDKARAEWDKARAEWNKEIEALHREECPNCPWDGGTIFPSTD